MRAACSLFLVSALAAVAHDLEIRPILAPPAVIVAAAYAGTEPVPFAKVQIFSPADAAHEFQAGNTDKTGKFSFVPDRGGAWRVVIDDEIGHRQETSVQIPESFAGSATGAAKSTASGGASRIERAITGIAILLGLTGLWYGRSRHHRPLS
jgi:nickel transport protein